ncbi:hypothetical protein BAUCODRAFT_214432 [Baudoinia panamericana UAMH 10762]|uniref:C2H2-type domain-containing protein n=1 Tax=Baudoinia panamericana (strain UAMH 10762) TaxID=717646 RepID=M2LIC6_BAUPA|nr:uncharacterized protein BAUCODRAFT_214432 [Baudoinia panamericana UAMH 10762]EMC93922.1 hypothetical protein BAUCODRAFT_214432 [Baudoinia panamericana UAMH 10762]
MDDRDEGKWPKEHERDSDRAGAFSAEPRTTFPYDHSREVEGSPVPLVAMQDFGSYATQGEPTLNISMHPEPPSTISLQGDPLAYSELKPPSVVSKDEVARRGSRASEDARSSNIAPTPTNITTSVGHGDLEIPFVQVQNSDGTWSCAVAGCTRSRRYVRPSDLAKHQRVHDPMYKLHCSYCDFIAMFPSHMREHVGTKHFGRVYICPAEGCGASFGMYANLVGTGRHMSKYHPEVAKPTEATCRRYLHEPVTSMTDEGYYSLDKTPASTVAPGDDVDIEEDHRSIYSDNRRTGLDASTTNKLIRAFSDEVSQDLGPDLEAEDVSEALPELLYILSKLLQCDRNAPAELASTFVRQQRDNIAPRVIVRAEAEARESYSTIKAFDVDSWISGVGGTKDEPGERPADEADVNDLSDEVISEVTFPEQVEAVRNYVRKSAGYRWLLVRTRLAASMMQTGSEFQDLERELVGLCVSHGPSLKIRLGWSPTGFIRNQYSQTAEISIATAISYNGFGETLEALEVTKYVKRMWPTYGDFVLACVDNAVYGNHEKQNDMSVNLSQAADGMGSLILTTIEDELLAEVDGDPVAVFEMIAILAWLGAACRLPTHLAGPSYCTISLVPPSDECAFHQIRYHEHALSETGTAASDEGASHGIVDQSYPSTQDEPRSPDSHTSAHANDCWLAMIKNPSIVKGFPIARRYNSEKGMETSLDIMIALSRARWATIFDGMTVLRGFCTLLVAVQMHCDSVFWHYVLSGDLQPLLYSEAHKYCQPDRHAVAPSELQGLRHFIGWTPVAYSRIGTRDAIHSIYDVNYTGDDNLTKPGYALDGVTVGFSHYVTGSSKISVGNRDTPLTYSLAREYEMQVDHAANLFVIFYDCEARRAWMLDGREALLYLSRGFLSSPHALPRRNGFSERVVDQFIHRDHMIEGRRTAREILLQKQNREIKIYEGFTFEQLVSRFYETIWQMRSHVPKLQAAQRVNTTDLKKKFMHALEGFGFADTVSLNFPVRSRYARLGRSGKEWCRFVNTTGTVNILGKGFGQILGSLDNCRRCKELPGGPDFLATFASLLEDIARQCEGVTAAHLKLMQNLYWNRPNEHFATTACGCTQLGARCGEAILELHAIPATTRSKFQPGLHHMHADAAVIIGRKCDICTRTASAPGNSTERYNDTAHGGTTPDSGIGSSQGSVSTPTPSMSDPKSVALSVSCSRSGRDSTNDFDAQVGEKDTTRSDTLEQQLSGGLQPSTTDTRSYRQPSLDIESALTQVSLDDLQTELERRKAVQECTAHYRWAAMAQDASNALRSNVASNSAEEMHSERKRKRVLSPTPN